MASPTQWTWVWVDSGSWWWIGRPGMLQSMALQRVGHDWGTGLNWIKERRERGVHHRLDRTATGMSGGPGDRTPRGSFGRCLQVPPLSLWTPARTGTRLPPPQSWGSWWLARADSAPVPADGRPSRRGPPSLSKQSKEWAVPSCCCPRGGAPWVDWSPEPLRLLPHCRADHWPALGAGPSSFSSSAHGKGFDCAPSSLCWAEKLRTPVKPEPQIRWKCF